MLQAPDGPWLPAFPLLRDDSWHAGGLFSHFCLVFVNDTLMVLLVPVWHLYLSLGINLLVFYFILFYYFAFTPCCFRENNRVIGVAKFL